ncbi:MAG: hypothetical protein Q4F17_11255 [Eubacteriales bacterium]|nr:hypothetical protein [Eubacteriales bacterium]
MTNLELLELIGSVKDGYIVQAQTHRVKKQPRRRSPWKLILLAAVMAFLLTGCAYAVMKLQDLKIADYNPEKLYPEETFASEEMNQDQMSLQGFAGSPGYLATKEWLEYWESSTHEETGFEAPEAYRAYLCFNQEMVDKIDELCAKYGLKPLGKEWTEQQNPERIFEAVGIPGIQVPGTETHIYGGYYFESGTFQVEAETTVPGVEEPFSFQYRCVMKDTLDYVTMIVGHMEDYDQWNHTLPDGTEVLLAYSREGALMVADKPDFFATLNTDAPSSREELEAFADTFSFDYHPQTVDGAFIDSRHEQELEDQYGGIIPELKALGLQQYVDFVDMNRGAVHGDDATYALYDVNHDGKLELLLGTGQTIDSIGTYNDISYVPYEVRTAGIKSGSGYVFCEDDIIAIQLAEPETLHYLNHYLNDNEFDWDTDLTCQHYWYVTPGGDGYILADYVERDLEGNWGRSLDGDADCELSITEEEAREIIASYKPIHIQMKPVHLNEE